MFVVFFSGYMIWDVASQLYDVWVCLKWGIPPQITHFMGKIALTVGTGGGYPFSDKSVCWVST